MRLFLILACSLLRLDVASSKNVAVVMAGLFRGSPQSAAEYERAVVAPLLRVNWGVHTYLGGFAEDEAAWRGWLRGSASNVTFVRLVPDVEKSSQDTQYFGACTQLGYGLRNAHLADAWAAAKASGVQFHYAVKTRNDVAYGPGQFIRPCWLAGLAESVVLINDKELHSTDRWAERGHESVRELNHINLSPATPWAAQQTLPLMTSDQFMVGTHDTMEKMLNIASQPPVVTDPLKCETGRSAFWEWMTVNRPGNPENVIADFMYTHRIAWYPVSLQLTRAPRDPPIPDAGAMFITTPCRLCYDCVSSDPYSV